MRGNIKKSGRERSQRARAKDGVESAGVNAHSLIRGCQAEKGDSGTMCRLMNAACYTQAHNRSVFLLSILPLLIKAKAFLGLVRRLTTKSMKGIQMAGPWQ